MSRQRHTSSSHSKSDRRYNGHSKMVEEEDGVIGVHSTSGGAAELEQQQQQPGIEDDLELARYRRTILDARQEHARLVQQQITMYTNVAKCMGITTVFAILLVSILLLSASQLWKLFQSLILLGILSWLGYVGWKKYGSKYMARYFAQRRIQNHRTERGRMLGTAGGGGGGGGGGLVSASGSSGAGGAVSNPDAFSFSFQETSQKIRALGRENVLYNEDGEIAESIRGTPIDGRYTVVFAAVYFGKTITTQGYMDLRFVSSGTGDGCGWEIRGSQIFGKGRNAGDSGTAIEDGYLNKHGQMYWIVADQNLGKRTIHRGMYDFTRHILLDGEFQTQQPNGPHGRIVRLEYQPTPQQTQQRNQAQQQHSQSVEMVTIRSNNQSSPSPSSSNPTTTTARDLLA